MPTCQATHHEASRSNSRSRSTSVSSFESRTLLTRLSRGSTAAPTASGPAHAPRPTSSIPTTTSWPSAHSCFSRAAGGSARASTPSAAQRTRPRLTPGAHRPVRPRPADDGEAGVDGGRRRGRRRRPPAARPTSAGRSTAPRAPPTPAVDDDPAGQVLAVAGVAAGAHARLGGREGAVVERQARRCRPRAWRRRALGHLPRVAADAEAGHVGDGVHARRPAPRAPRPRPG